MPLFSASLSLSTPNCVGKHLMFLRLVGRRHHFAGTWSASATSSTCRAVSASSSGPAAGSSTEKRIAIFGGGLAGLSVALHLLENITRINSNSNREQHQRVTLSVTVLDCAAAPGLGGASAVAGGYVVACCFLNL